MSPVCHTFVRKPSLHTLNFTFHNVKDHFAFFIVEAHHYSLFVIVRVCVLLFLCPHHPVSTYLLTNLLFLLPLRHNLYVYCFLLFSTSMMNSYESNTISYSFCIRNSANANIMLHTTSPAIIPQQQQFAA